MVFLCVILLQNLVWPNVDPCAVNKEQTVNKLLVIVRLYNSSFAFRSFLGNEICEPFDITTSAL